MAEAEQGYVICYDIADNRRRTLLAKVLDGFGQRVQYSVYEAVLNRTLFDKLTAQMLTIVDAEADRLTIYPLCAACVARRWKYGSTAKDWRGDEIVYVV